MRICILADVQSAHTKRWAQGILEKGNEVIVISFRQGEIPGVKCYTLNSPSIFGISPSVPQWAKFHYLFGRRAAQKIIDDFAPDIVHAFWATSYGFLAARLKTSRLFISVWGMDITDSPRNPLMKKIVLFTLKRAEKVFCTSEFLLEKTKPYVDCKEKLVHIPFGIDTELFNPISEKAGTTTVIGSTKSFEVKYGLINLVKAFCLISDEIPNLTLNLVGSGSLRESIQTFIRNNCSGKAIIVEDSVDVHEVPTKLNHFDIFVMPSISESETFGVAALEASSCEIPVIASNIGGIPEVVVNGITGILVPPDDVAALVEALRTLIIDKLKRIEMGKAGRKFVKSHYVWDNNVSMLQSYYTRADTFPVPTTGECE